ncbi:MAG: MFS transporter [Candidatus Hodarchaeales archaeon]
MQIYREHNLFSLFFLFGLILLNGIGATLPIPNIKSIAETYDFQYLGFIEAVFITLATIFLVIWGYLVDKIERKVALLVSTVLWSLAALFIALFYEFGIMVYVIGRLIMAIGLSALSPLAYSILADFARYNERGLVASGLNISWVGSSAAGILIGAIFASLWHFSFLLIALFGALVIICQKFINIPERGIQEPSFVGFENFHYPWKITFTGLKNALRSWSIFWLLIQGIFALIPGTIFTYWLIAFLSSDQGLSIGVVVTSVFAITIASGRAVGYPFFGKLGDYLFSKNQTPNVRVIIASLCMVGQAVFFFLAFMSIDSDIILGVIIFGIFFWIGSFIGAASGPNRTALMFDLSMPEQRGSLGALFSLTDQFGEIIGLVFSTYLLQTFTYVEVFLMSLVFYFMAGGAWLMAIFTVEREHNEVTSLLDHRAQEMSLHKL